MPARIINGKEIADAVLADIAARVRASDKPLHLAAVCAGDDAGLRSFVRIKQKAAQSVGIQFSSYFFDFHDLDGAYQAMRYLAADETVQGIFIELPLPSGWDANRLIALIPPEKDVDALSRCSALVSEPAVRALRHVLRKYDIKVRGVSAAVVGYGRLVGKPIAQWLSELGAKVSVIDIDTREPAMIAARADLIVTGVGKRGLVTGEWVKDGAMVIDFGCADGKGDVDFEQVQKKAGMITPVPGGMGPLVVVAVLENLVALATNTN